MGVKFTKKDKERFEQGKKRLADGIAGNIENRRQAVFNALFAAGKQQWDERLLRRRRARKRPCMVLNKIPGFMSVLLGEIRQQKLSIKVSPVDDLADVKVAKIREGLIRHIEYDSNSTMAYIQAATNQHYSNTGYLHVRTEYEAEDSFRQKIVFESVHDPNSVVMDPLSLELDGSDSWYGFIFEDMNEDAFKAEFPGVDIPANKYSAFAEDPVEKHWYATEESYRVATYYFKETTKRKLTLYSNNVAYFDDDLTTMEKVQMRVFGIKPVDERYSEKTRVMGMRMCGADILEKPREVKCSSIPIVPVYGKRIMVQGRWMNFAAHEHTHDSQRMYNLSRSSQAELLNEAPKARWIMTSTQRQGYERIWNSHNDDHKTLVYNPDSEAPPPQRINPPEGSVTYFREAQSYKDDIKEESGVFDSQLGSRGSQESGKAIRLREMQGQRGNFEFMDNLAYSIARLGRIINEMLPAIYDDERIILIMGEDETTTERVLIAPGDENGALPEGAIDLGEGKYDVRVAVGPSYASQRLESLDSLMDLLGKIPEIAPDVVDIAVANMDIKDAEEIAERLRRRFGISDGVTDADDPSLSPGGDPALAGGEAPPPLEMASESA